MTSLTLKREGRFTVQNRGKHWCGTREMQTIVYRVKVVCNVTLDQRGFLFDQLSIERFFNLQTTCETSCEEFTLACARRLWAEIKKEHSGCEIRKLIVTLSPAPYSAEMTFEFEDEGKAA
jgi:hypothetical protein